MRQIGCYSALPHKGWIRLLKILPGVGPLDCTLRNAELSVVQNSFDALSYVWGADVNADHVDITCNGQTIGIGTNLAGALERIRQSNDSKVIWADAICINQEDNEERSLQVFQMSEIYSAARSVLIWIGDGHPEEAETCFNLIESTNKLSRHLLTQYDTVEDIPVDAYDKVLGSVPQEAWNTIRHLTDAAWFTRVWVIQEVGLARSASLLYGNSEMAWYELVDFMLFVAGRPDLAAYAGDVSAGMFWDVFEDIWLTFNNTESWRSTLSYMVSFPATTSDSSFVSIANVIRPYRATDARDYVYALLGHPSASTNSSDNEKIVEVDYDKSITEVYTALATYTVTHDRFPWTALTCVDHTEDMPALKGQRPSWVPCWNEGWRVYWLGYPAMWYRAGGLDVGQFRARVSSDNSLRIDAIMLDQITWTSDHLTSSSIMAERHSSADPIGKIWSDLTEYDGPSRYGDTRDTELAFSLVTIAGRARDEGPADEDMVMHARLYYSTRTSGPSASVMDEENILTTVKSVDLHTKSFIRNQARALHNRRVFRTLTGYYGICHFGVSEGDYCVVMQGANVPFVLRRLTQDTVTSVGQACYRLVGESYIQGVMKGELLKCLSEQISESTEFVKQEIIIQ